MYSRRLPGKGTGGGLRPQAEQRHKLALPGPGTHVTASYLRRLPGKSTGRRLRPSVEDWCRKRKRYQLIQDGVNLLSSGVHVGNQFGLEVGDLVFQFEFALLQPRELQLVDTRIHGQTLDGQIQIAMLFA